MPLLSPLNALALAAVLLTSANAATPSVQTFPVQAVGMSAGGAGGQLSVRAVSAQQ